MTTHKDNEEVLRRYTRGAWTAFNRLDNDFLDALLEAAGVVVPSKRSAKLQSALLVWFYRVPHLYDDAEFHWLNKVYRDLENL